MDSPRVEPGPIESDFNVDNLLSPFLRALANRIDNNQLNDKQLQRVGEFFMSYLFDNQVENDNDSSEECNISDNEFKKFLILGWWVYTQIPRLINEE